MSKTINKDDMIVSIIQRMKLHKPTIADEIYISKEANSYCIFIFVPSIYRYDKYTIEAAIHYTLDNFTPDSIISSIFLFEDYNEFISNTKIRPHKMPNNLSMYFILVIWLDDDIPAGGGEPYTSDEDYSKEIWHNTPLIAVQRWYGKKIISMLKGW